MNYLANQGWLSSVFFSGAMFLSLGMLGCSPSGGTPEGAPQNEAPGTTENEKPAAKTSPTRSENTSARPERLSTSSTPSYFLDETYRELRRRRLAQNKTLEDRLEKISKKIESFLDGSKVPNGSLSGMTRYLDFSEIGTLEQDVAGFKVLLVTYFTELSAFMKANEQKTPEIALHPEVAESRRQLGAMLLEFRTVVAKVLTLRSVATMRNPNLNLPTDSYDFINSFTVQIPTNVAIDLENINVAMPSRFETTEGPSLIFDWSKASLNTGEPVNVRLSLWYVKGVLETAKMFQGDLDEKALFDLVQFITVQQLETNARTICRRLGKLECDEQPQYDPKFQARFSMAKLYPLLKQERVTLEDEQEFKLALTEVANKRITREVPEFFTEQSQTEFQTDKMQRLGYGQASVEDAKAFDTVDKDEIVKRYLAPLFSFHILNKRNYIFTGLNNSRLRHELVLNAIAQSLARANVVRLIINDKDLALVEPAATASPEEVEAIMSSNRAKAEIAFYLERRIEKELYVYKKRLAEKVDVAEWLEEAQALMQEKRAQTLLKSNFAHRITTLAGLINNQMTTGEFRMKDAITAALEGSQPAIVIPPHSTRLAGWIGEMTLEKDPITQVVIKERDYLGAKSEFMRILAENLMLPKPKGMSGQDYLTRLEKRVTVFKLESEGTVKPEQQAKLDKAVATFKAELKIMLQMGRELKFFTDIETTTPGLSTPAMTAAQLFSGSPEVAKKYNSAALSKMQKDEPLFDIEIPESVFKIGTAAADDTSAKKRKILDLLQQAERQGVNPKPILDTALILQKRKTFANITKVSGLTPDKHFDLKSLLDSALVNGLVLSEFSEFNESVRVFLRDFGQKNPLELVATDYVQKVFGPTVEWGFYGLLASFALRGSLAAFGSRTLPLRYFVRSFTTSANLMLAGIYTVTIASMAVAYPRDYSDWSDLKSAAGLVEDLQYSSITDAIFHDVSTINLYRDTRDGLKVKVLSLPILVLAGAGFHYGNKWRMRFGPNAKMTEWLSKQTDALRTLGIKNPDLASNMNYIRAQAAAQRAAARGLPDEALILDEITEAESFLINAGKNGHFYRVSSLLNKKPDGLTAWEKGLWKMGQEMNWRMERNAMSKYFRENTF